MSSKDDERGYLGERLNDHPSPYQPDGPLGWDRMAPKLFPRRKRRGVFLWWTVGGLVVVVGLLYILFPDQFQPGTPAPVAARTTIPPPDPAEVPITDITGSGTQASTKIQGGSVENTPALAPKRMADRPPEPSQTYAPGFRQRDLRPGMPDSSEVTRDLPPPVAGPVVGEKADPVQVLPLQPLVAAPPGFPLRC